MSRAPRASPAPQIAADPVEFWRVQYEQAVADAEMARDDAPSVLPKLVALQREAWREWKSAEAAKDGGGTPAQPGPEASPPPVDTSFEARLAKVRRALAAAEAKGSAIAVDKLLAREGELLDAIQARDEAARKAARGAMTPEERVAALVARIQQMPAAMQEQVRGRLGWQG